MTQRGSPSPANTPASNAKASKWQPLAAVDPSPVTGHDPFSLGDSDDEEPKKSSKQDSVTSEASADKAVSDVSASNKAKPIEETMGSKENETEKSVAKS